MPNVGTMRRTSMADALFSRTRQRVLGLLFGNPHRTFYAKDIIRRTGAGSGAVQREIERLAASELLLVTKVGNQKHYQANSASPVFEELRALIMKTSWLVEPLRSALQSLSPRVRLAFIYGSVARGSDRATSDIDIFIVADDLTLEEVFAAFAPAEKQIGRPIHPTIHTVDEYERGRAKEGSFIHSVLTTKRIHLAGDEDAVSGAR